MKTHNFWALPLAAYAIKIKLAGESVELFPPTLYKPESSEIEEPATTIYENPANDWFSSKSRESTRSGCI
jgi:hypothetical protein